MKYTMTDPCPNCPFRCDSPGYLTQARMRSIIEGNGEFQCHKTVDYTDSDDNDGEGNGETKNAQHCAGLLILLEHIGMPHQMMRIAERLGMYDRRRLNMQAPIHQSVAKAIRAQQR